MCNAFFMPDFKLKIKHKSTRFRAFTEKSKIENKKTSHVFKPVRSFDTSELRNQKRQVTTSHRYDRFTFAVFPPWRIRQELVV